MQAISNFFSPFFNHRLSHDGSKSISYYGVYHWSIYFSGIGVLAASVILIHGIVFAAPLYIFQGALFVITSCIGFYASRKIDELTGLENANKQLRQEINNEQKQVTKLKEIQIGIKNDLKKEEAQHDMHILELKNAYEKTEKQLALEEKKCRTLEKNLEALKDQVKDMHDQSDDNISKIKQIFKNKNGLSRQLESLNQENQKLKISINEYAVIEEKLKRDITELEKSNHSLTDAVQRLELENEEMQSQREQLERQQKEMGELIKMGKMMVEKTENLNIKINQHVKNQTK